MKLFHGSNMKVDNLRIIVSDRRLDFGYGFYLTSSFEQANKWALLTTKRKQKGKPVISVFEFDEKKIDQLSVLKFDQPSKDWLKYVSFNRNIPDYHDDFDLVIGPVANDQTMPVLKLYFSRIYDGEEAIKRLLPQKLKDQYAIKTNKGLDALTFVEEIIL